MQQISTICVLELQEIHKALLVERQPLVMIVGQMNQGQRLLNLGLPQPVRTVKALVLPVASAFYHNFHLKSEDQ